MVPVEDAVDVSVLVIDVVAVLVLEEVWVEVAVVVPVVVPVDVGEVVGVESEQPSNDPSTRLRIAMFSVATVSSQSFPASNAPPTVQLTPAATGSDRYAATTTFNLNWLALHDSASFNGVLFVPSNVFELQVTAPTVPLHAAITAFSSSSWLSHSSVGNERYVLPVYVVHSSFP